MYSIYNNFYNTNTGSDASLYKAPEITSTIKENDGFQTAEIEKGEIVAKPELAALYKANGKTHAQGGIKTYLEPDSFVYSNDNSMAFTKQDHAMMELKAGTKTNKSNNTPAEVLKRNIDIEHYNRLVNNLKDPTTNDITKKSSALMLSKYQATLGKIAYLQEQKKNFEEPLPDFAQDTAPVYDAQTKTDIKEQPQYMKYGGTLSKFTLGGNPYDENASKCPCGGTYPNCIPCSPQQLAVVQSKSAMSNLAGVKGMDFIGRTPQADLYHTGTDPYGRIKPGMSNDQWTNYLKNESPQRKAQRLASYSQVDGTDKFAQIPRTNNQLTIPGKLTATITPGSQETVNGPGPVPSLDMHDSQPYNPYVGMSFDQSLNLGYAGLNAASVKRYDPYRQQQLSPLVQLEGFNAQGAINNAQGAANKAINASQALNPYLANASNMEILGKSIDSTNQITSQYADKNVDIRNRQNETNNQIQRQDLQANLNNDAKYYDQTVTARQNFDDLKTTANNDVMSLYNNYRGQNRQLQEFLSQQQVAGSVPVKGKDGKIYYQDMPLYGYDSWSGRTYKTQAGNILNAKAMPQKDAMYRQYQQIMQKIIDSGDPKALAVLANTFDNNNNAFTGTAKYKKGGSYNPYL